MSKKSKIPKLSKKEIAELAQAVQFAFSDPAADEFFDQVMAEARRLDEQRLEREEQTRTE
jgi:hypothetical protein